MKLDGQSLRGREIRVAYAQPSKGTLQKPARNARKQRPTARAPQSSVQKHQE